MVVSVGEGTEGECPTLVFTWEVKREVFQKRKVSRHSTPKDRKLIR